MSSMPPKWMMRFFRWFCRRDLVDAVEGDLLEQYQRQIIRSGQLLANLKFLFNVLRFFQPIMIRSNKRGTQLNALEMFMNNFVFFIRSLKRHRTFALLNLTGLMLGTAAFIYMMGYVQHERSYDSHHELASQIYRVTSQKIQDGDPQLEKASASVALTEVLRNSFAEIETVSRVHILDVKRQIVQVTDILGNTQNYTETKAFHAEDGYFNIFSDKMLIGDRESALREPNSIVLTESLAKKYFGAENPIGKIIRLTDFFEMDYQVTGVVEDVPQTAHFQYDLLISFNTFEKQRPTWRWTSWDWDYFHTYLLVKRGTDITELQSKINSTVAQVGKEVFTSRGYQMAFSLQNIRDIHLYSDMVRELSQNGNGRLFKYVEIIAIFVLVLAWVNYINLSTARSALRAKEIGVRKVTGALRSTLVVQLLTESFLLNLLATIGGLGLLLLLSGVMSPLTGYNFDLSAIFDTTLGLQLVAALLVGSLCAGGYPAIILSGYQPVKVLKGSFQTSKKGIGLRKVLVIFQLVVSLVLFVGAVSVYKQVNYLSSRDLGIDLDQVLVVNMPNLRDNSFWRDYDRFKLQVQGDPSVDEVTTTNFIPGAYLNKIESFKRREQEVQEAKGLKLAWVDFDFTELFDLQLVAGRNFERERNSELRTGILLNESAAKVLGFDSPDEVVDKAITWVHFSGETEEYTAIGVINDFDQDALGGAEPMVYIMNRPQAPWFEVNYVSIKVTSADIFQTITTVSEAFENTYPTDSFDYFFMGSHFDQRYQTMAKFGKVLGVFTTMAIIISNLGLFGLIAFVALQRKKEVSIRKVLGATVTDIVGLFSRQFAWHFLIALIIAIPIIYYGLSVWLNGFVYQISLSVGLFLIPSAVVISMALGTVLYQSISASLVNPSDNLQSD